MGATASTPPVIRWVNHASFVYSRGGVRLLCDPWLSGPAFNYGWRHITPTQFTYDDFAGVTHVWISHQHPDHFAPQDLRRASKADRQRLTVLYQPVPDKLVVSWLRSAGFNDVRELPLERWMALDDAVEIMCGSLDDDSWLAIRGGGVTLLNVNDCVLKERPEITRIAQAVGPVDVLFTQFSYAQWSGNPDETQRRREDAREKYDRIRLQCEVFDPKTVVPFASFIYFSNSENFFMNDSMNRVGEVCEFIERELGRTAVALYPGESWRIPERVDWHKAAQRYQADMDARIAAGPVDAPRVPGDLNAFLQQVSDFLTRLRAKNPPARFLLRDQATIYLTDHRCAYRLSLRGLQPIAATVRDVDVATSTENIVYAFRTPWGGNTLHVSGRFESYGENAHLRFFRLMRKLHYYNRTTVDGAWWKNQSLRLYRAVLRRGSAATKRIASRLARERAKASQ